MIYQLLELVRCILVLSVTFTVTSRECHVFSNHRYLYRLFKNLFRLTPRKRLRSTSLSLCGEFISDRWIPLTNFIPLHNSSVATSLCANASCLECILFQNIWGEIHKWLRVKFCRGKQFRLIIVALVCSLLNANLNHILQRCFLTPGLALHSHDLVASVHYQCARLYFEVLISLSKHHKMINWYPNYISLTNIFFWSYVLPWQPHKLWFL